MDSQPADNAIKMPMLFIGHGSPMNALEDNEYSLTWSALASSLPTPKAILCISAHWQTVVPQVTAMRHPDTIHDFSGFPPALSALQYPAPGDPALAKAICALSRKGSAIITPDSNWGLDHGSWSILHRLFPKANIPVVQLSLMLDQSPAWHYEFAKILGELRRQGVLILGSGNIVHNLRTLIWEDTAHDWAIAFANKIREFISKGDHQSVINYADLGHMAQLAVPTDEHFLPLLYILGLQEANDVVSFFNDKTTLGAISMLSLQMG